MAWILGKKEQSFTASETVKEFIIAVLNELAMDNLVNEQVLTSIKSIPVSDTSTGRGMDILTSEIHEILLTWMSKANMRCHGSCFFFFFLLWCPL